MKNLRLRLLILFTVILFLDSCRSTKDNYYRLTTNYKPDDQQLYDTIVKLDSVFFEAYNTCAVNLDKYGSFFSENIEFYHDKGGLLTSKQDVIEAIKLPPAKQVDL